MSFLSVIGELTGFSNKKGWKLKNLDFPMQTPFEGDFPITDMAENVGSVISEITTVGKQTPLLQWVHGDSETITFTAVFYATTSFKNVTQKVNVLKQMARKEPKLGRTPHFLFTSGTEISHKCSIKGVRHKYTELRSDGTIRGFYADVTLQKLEADQDTGFAPTSLASKIKFAAGIVAGAAGLYATARKLKWIPGGSLHSIERTVDVVKNMSFESIARREYGNALLGDVLRRTQPEIADLKVGDKVELVDSKEIRQIAVTPQAIALKDTQVNINLREEFLSMRNRPTKIII
jgi:phage protein U